MYLMVYCVIAAVCTCTLLSLYNSYCNNPDSRCLFNTNYSPTLSSQSGRILLNFIACQMFCSWLYIHVTIVCRVFSTWQQLIDVPLSGWGEKWNHSMSRGWPAEGVGGEAAREVSNHGPGCRGWAGVRIGTGQQQGRCEFSIFVYVYNYVYIRWTLYNLCMYLQ